MIYTVYFAFFKMFYYLSLGYEGLAYVYLSVCVYIWKCNFVSCFHRYLHSCAHIYVQMHTQF